jgi:hypothetical protein
MILPKEKKANCITTPSVHCSLGIFNIRKKLERQITAMHEKKPGKRNTGFKGKKYCSSIPAINGSNSLRKGACFHIFICFTVGKSISTASTVPAKQKNKLSKAAVFKLFSYGTLYVFLTVILPVKTRYLDRFFHGSP